MHAPLLVCGQDHAFPLVFQAHVAASVPDCRSANRCPAADGCCSSLTVCTKCLLVWQDCQRACEAGARAACQGRLPHRILLCCLPCSACFCFVMFWSTVDMLDSASQAMATIAKLPNAQQSQFVCLQIDDTSPHLINMWHAKGKSQ